MSSLWGIKEARKSPENQVERKGSQGTNVNAGIAGASYIAVIFTLTGFLAIFTPPLLHLIPVLLYRHRLGAVARLVDIFSLADSYVICQQL